jgi:hypothetical protein
MEKSELQHIVSLNEDQVPPPPHPFFVPSSDPLPPPRHCQISVLKATIREMESTLSRERELNSSGHTLNAEYLANVLKSFLMTKSASEQAKLVSVLCSILHFQSDDTKEICELWSKKAAAASRGAGVAGAGLMGWFLPPAAPASSREEPPNREQYTDGIGGLDIY